MSEKLPFLCTEELVLIGVYFQSVMIWSSPKDADHVGFDYSMQFFHLSRGFAPPLHLRSHMEGWM